MKNNILNIIFFLIILNVGLSAQEDKDDVTVPRLTIKTSLTTLINPSKMAWQIGSDVRLGPKVSIDGGLGHFFYSETFANYKGESYKGPRARLGIKWHFSRSDNRSMHIGLESKLNNVTHKSFVLASRHGGEYFEQLLKKRQVLSGGVAFRWGVQHYVGNKHQILLESFIGLGILTHRVTQTLPPNAELIEEGRLINFEYSPGIHTVPDFIIGFQIGYVLW